MAAAGNLTSSDYSQTCSNESLSSPKDFVTSTPRRQCTTSSEHELSETQQDCTPSPEQVQDILHRLPSVLQFLQGQQNQIPNRAQDRGTEIHSLGISGQLPLLGHHQTYSGSQHQGPSHRLFSPAECDRPINRQDITMTREPQISQLCQTPSTYPQTLHGNMPTWASVDSSSPPVVKKKESKEKKSITTKTFAKGMMDVSLLTSNATQLRSVLSSPSHEFYNLLLLLITLSVLLQIISSVLLIVSDFYKTQVKETDRQNQRKRKFLNFVSLALITIVTSLNVLISAFYSPGMEFQGQKQPDIPQFSSSTYMTSKHSEL